MVEIGEAGDMLFPHTDDAPVVAAHWSPDRRGPTFRSQTPDRRTRLARPGSTGLAWGQRRGQSA
jgi:hypothetical protein